MTSTRDQVFIALDHVAQSLNGLEAPVMRAILPVLHKAHDEVQRELRQWISRQNGSHTFTAQRHRNVLASLRHGLDILDSTGGLLEKALKKEFANHIGPLSVRNLKHEWEMFGAIFEGSVQPLAIQEAVVIAEGKKLLWPQFKSSAARYAGEIGERAQLQLAISRMRSETIQELTNRLQRHLPDVFRSNRWSAERLARTETMSAYNTVHRQGIEEAHSEDGEIRSRCDASYDWRRCPMCGSMDGQVINRSKGEKFHAVWTTFSKKRGMRQHHMEFENMPFHPCCLPGDSLVTSGSRVSAVSKRWYDGDLVIVRTASGKHLASTPNHPILTDRGWVASGLLHVGCNVVCNPGIDGMGSGDHKHEHVPTRIEQVADAFRSSGEMAPTEVPVSPEDFHGDGEGSEVAVVWANRLLLNASDVSIREHLHEIEFERTHGGQALLTRESLERALIESLLSPFRSIVGSGAPGIALMLAHLSHRHDVGFGLSSDMHSGLGQSSSDGTPFYAESLGERQFGLAGHVCRDQGSVIDNSASVASGNTAGREAISDEFYGNVKPVGDLPHGLSRSVFFDNVVSVQRQSFHGFVYNLQTYDEHYTANGIVVHNCRCNETIWRESWAKYARKDQVSGGQDMAA